MKRAKHRRNHQDIAPEYDFSSGVRGKYARRYAEGSNVVVLDPDVAAVFRDSHAVNDVLRSLAVVLRKQSKNATKR
jgi:hypothetical protein